MREVVNYINVAASSIVSLDDSVEDYILEGWQPVGSATITILEPGVPSSTTYSQTMVRYKEE